MLQRELDVVRSFIETNTAELSALEADVKSLEGLLLEAMEKVEKKKKDIAEYVETRQKIESALEATKGLQEDSIFLRIRRESEIARKATGTIEVTKTSEPAPAPTTVQPKPSQFGQTKSQLREELEFYFQQRKGQWIHLNVVSKAFPAHTKNRVNAILNGMSNTVSCPLMKKGSYKESVYMWRS